MKSSTVASKYLNISSLVLQLFLIQANNADFERVFSLVRIIKTDFHLLCIMKQFLLSLVFTSIPRMYAVNNPSLKNLSLIKPRHVLKKQVKLNSLLNACIFTCYILLHCHNSVSNTGFEMQLVMLNNEDNTQN